MEAIENVIRMFFKSLENADEALFETVTHPDIRTVNIGNSNQILVMPAEEIRKKTIQGLRNAMQHMPGFYARREITAIQHIAIHDLIATAEIAYRMEMPDSLGVHMAFIHLAQVDGKWLVINIIDRGIEEARK